MKRIALQTWRGCGCLPHVGTHPGTWIFFFLLLIGCFAGGFIGAAIMAVTYGPVYLWGAYDRAQFSDCLSLKKAPRAA